MTVESVILREGLNGAMLAQHMPEVNVRSIVENEKAGVSTRSSRLVFIHCIPFHTYRVVGSAVG